MVFCSLLSSTYTLHTLETPIREALLKPRNFNPHPYGQNLYNHQATIDVGVITAHDTDQNIPITDAVETFPARYPSNGIERFVNLMKE